MSQSRLYKLELSLGTQRPKSQDTRADLREPCLAAVSTIPYPPETTCANPNLPPAPSRSASGWLQPYPAGEVGISHEETPARCRSCAALGIRREARLALGNRCRCQ